MYLPIECTHCQSSSSNKGGILPKNCTCLSYQHKQQQWNDKGQEKISARNIQINLKENFLEIHLLWHKSIRSPFRPFPFRKVVQSILLFFVLQTAMGFAFVLNIFTLYLFCALLFFVWFYQFFYQPLPFLFNKVTIKIDKQFISIKNGPLPNTFAYGKDLFATAEIQQLYIRRSKKKRTKEEKERKSYAICAVLKNKETISLIEPLISPSEALFLEKEIQLFLGL